MIDRKPIAHQFIKFGIVGVTNSVVWYIVYSALIYFSTHYIIANFVAFVISVLNSFFLNNKYVFKDENRTGREMLKALGKSYLVYFFTGIVLTSALLYVFIDVFTLSAYLAPLLTYIVTIPTNFILNKVWAFQDRV